MMRTMEAGVLNVVMAEVVEGVEILIEAEMEVVEGVEILTEAEMEVEEVEEVETVVVDLTTGVARNVAATISPREAPASSVVKRKMLIPALLQI